MEELNELKKFDFKNILQDSFDVERKFFEKLATAGSKINLMLRDNCKDIGSEKEFSSRITEAKQNINELNEQIVNLNREMDSKNLNQTLVEKELHIIVTFMETNKEKLETIKKSKESLAIQIEDKEKELKEKKEEKIRDCDALKRASFIYKEKLDMRIRGEFSVDNENITVTFFYKKFDDKYYVNLSCENKIWKVSKIEPDLNVEYGKELTTIENFPTDMTVKDITAFLCQIRKIFLKYYYKK